MPQVSFTCTENAITHNSLLFASECQRFLPLLKLSFRLTRTYQLHKDLKNVCSANASTVTHSLRKKASNASLASITILYCKPHPTPDLTSHSDLQGAIHPTENICILLGVRFVPSFPLKKKSKSPKLLPRLIWLPDRLIKPITSQKPTR